MARKITVKGGMDTADATYNISDNSSKTSTRGVVSSGKTFRAAIEISFINIETGSMSNKENVTEINSNRIVYVMFNYEYQDKEMPMIITYLQVPVALYKKIIDRQQQGKVKLKIKGRNPLAKNNISEIRLEQTFNYVTVNQNQPYGITTKDTTEEDKYRGIYIGLVDNDMSNYLRTSFNGIYTNVSLKDLLSLALDGFKKNNYIIEPFKYNYNYKQIIVPACSTRKKFLEFLYDYDQFYDDEFMFFIDFDKVYLMSQSGNGGSGSTFSDKNIIIDVRPVTEAESYTQGYTIDGNSIYIYFNQMDVSVNINTSTDQVVNNVVSYGERRDSKSYKMTDGNRNLFVRAGSDDDESAAIVKNIETSSTLIELAKNNIPDYIFEPDRVITLKMYKDYAQYSGKYRLQYKRVLYKVDDDEFICAVNIGLVPVGNIVTKKGVNKTNNKAVSTTARTVSSAQQSSSEFVTRSEYLTKMSDDEALDFR